MCQEISMKGAKDEEVRVVRTLRNTINVLIIKNVDWTISIKSVFLPTINIQFNFYEKIKI